jgi:hypothetical protein
MVGFPPLRSFKDMSQPVIWLRGNVIQDFLEVFIKFVVNQTEQLV